MHDLPRCRPLHQRCSRQAAAVLALLLALPPAGLEAQAIGGPRPSVLWMAPPTSAGRDSIPDQGWTASKGALVGAVVGAAAGAVAGHWVCHRFGTNGDCTGNALWGGAMFGALGLLLGALAGKDAEN